MAEEWVPQVGEIVEAKINGVWRRAIILSGSSNSGFMIRRSDRGVKGAICPSVWRNCYQVHRVQRLNPVTCNVIADWLDDHDQPEAAALLREAFPLEDGR